MSRVSLAAVVLAASVVSLAESKAAEIYSLGGLPGSSHTWTSGISADGSVVVGYSIFPDSHYEGFRWTLSGGMAGLGALPGGNGSSVADGISRDGSVIVGSSSSSAGWQGFRWTASGGMMGLGIPAGASSSDAYDVSADGSVVVGRVASAGGYEAYRWTASRGTVGLGTLSSTYPNSGGYAVSADGSVVVGQASSSNASQSFRWTASGGMTGLDPSGGNGVAAYAVSADGSVVVGKSSAGDAFRWTASEGLVHLGYFSRYGTALTADGSIVVGNGSIDFLHDVGFIWDSAHGMRTLQDVLSQDYGLSISGWREFGVPWGISADGSAIVGTGIRPDGTKEPWIVTGLFSHWAVDADGNWSASQNWSGSIPSGIGSRATFGNVATATRTVTLNTGVVMGTLNFDVPDVNNGYRIAGPGTLTMQVSGGTAAIDVISGRHTISTPIVLASDINFWVSNASDSLTLQSSIDETGGPRSLSKSGGGTLVLGSVNTYTGATNFNGGFIEAASLGNLGNGAALTFDGGGLRFTGVFDPSGRTLMFNAGGAILDTNGLTIILANPVGNNGSGGLTKNGNGTLVLSSANSYSGGTTINAGTVQIQHNNALGSGSVTMKSSNANLLLQGGINVPNKLVGLLGDASGANSNGLRSIGGNNTWAGDIELGNSSDGTAVSRIKVEVEKGTKVEENTLTIKGNILTGNHGDQFVLGGPLPNGDIDYNEGIGTINGIISGKGFLRHSILSTGTWILTEHNTYQGYTCIPNGVVSVIFLDDGERPSGIGQSSNAALNLELGGGTLQYKGTGDSTDRLFCLTGNSAIDASGTGPLVFSNTGQMGFVGAYTGLGKGLPGNHTLTLTGSNTGTNTMAVSIGDGGPSAVTSLAKTNTGTWILTGANTYSGATTIGRGVLTAGGAENPGISGPFGKPETAAGSIIFAGGTLQYSASNAFDYSDRLTTDGTNSYMIDTSNRTVTFATGLTASGISGLTKSGAGTLSLSASNAYSGATTVLAGSLEIAGGIDPAGTTLIDVQGGSATLKTVNVNKTNLNVSTSSAGAFVIGDGTYALGCIAGSGSTDVSDGASLTADSIVQNTLTIGAGGSVVIREITDSNANTVPEPDAWMLLAVGAACLLPLLRRLPIEGS
jgi:autotransporter-associated beta strand protein/probable HAF family extracellular repeat protein